MKPVGNKPLFHILAYLDRGCDPWGQRTWYSGKRYEALKTNTGCDLKVKKLVLMHQSKFGIFD
jgi:hypothetical protein